MKAFLSTAILLAAVLLGDASLKAAEPATLSPAFASTLSAS